MARSTQRRELVTGISTDRATSVRHSVQRVVDAYAQAGAIGARVTLEPGGATVSGFATPAQARAIAAQLLPRRNS